MELNSYFRSLLETIEPSATSVANAKIAHETLRSQLQDDDEASAADADSYLTGSYGRATAIKDIKDVDIIVMIDLDHTKTAPGLLVAWIQSILQKYYAKVRAQGRSVGVTTDSGFDLRRGPLCPNEPPRWSPLDSRPRRRRMGSYTPKRPNRLRNQAKPHHRRVLQASNQDNEALARPVDARSRSREVIHS